MVSGKTKESFLNQPMPIPYSRILEALKSGIQISKSARKNETVLPNRFIIFFNKEDRKFREKTEDVFVLEITRDIILYLKKSLEPETPIRVQIDIRTGGKLATGRLRIDCYQNSDLLYRFEQDENVDYSIETEEEPEWNAVDILPREEDSRKQILVVDDEPVLCAVLTRMLNRLGYQVVSANDGIAAIKIIKNMSIDLVITDLRMPQMDGWTLMKKAREKYSNLPFVLITGYHSIHTQSKATASSADGYISKPFSFQQIKELLNSILARKEESNSSVTHYKIK